MNSSHAQVDLPLSFAQRAVWHSTSSESVRSRLGEACRLDIHGHLNRTSLVLALRRTLEETSALRVRLVATGTGPAQQIDPLNLWDLPEIDFSSENAPDEHVEAWIRGRLGRSYDLAQGPLFDFALLRLATERWTLYLGYHQLALDPEGVTLFADRCADIYAALTSGSEAGPTPFGSFPDFLADDANQARSTEFTQAQNYFSRRRTDQPVPARLLPPDNLDHSTAPRTPSRTSGDDWHHIPPSADSLSSTGAEIPVSALAVYAARMQNLDEVVVGLAVDGRSTPLSRTVPMRAANILPVRLSISPDATWTDLRTVAVDDLDELQTHRSYRGEHIPRDPGTGLFPGPVVAVLPRLSRGFTGTRTSLRHIGTELTTDLSLRCRPADDGGLSFAVEAGFEHDAAIVADHQSRLGRLLTEAVAHPGDLVGDAALTTERDEERIIRTWNDTAMPFPDLTVPELFEKRVAEAPDAVAVDADTDTMSYAQLSLRSAQLARSLSGAGVQPGDAVGVLMKRSAELVVTLLAVARSGAACVPLDLRYPVERMRAILDHVGAALVVVDETTVAHEVTSGRQVLRAGASGHTGSGSLPDGTSDPGAPLHIIHTSGSTGVPKGVRITHRNVVKLALDRVWRGGTGHRMLFHSPHAWDACTLEVLVPLLVGGRVVVLSEDVNAVALRRLIGAGRVTVLWLTAGLFGALAEGDPSCLAGAREVWTGGDTVSPRAVARVMAACPDLEVFNGYGPVETTVFATRHAIGPKPAAGSVPIGTPMDNTRVYVLDERLRLVPPGASGQLYVAGLGVADGYAGQPGLTEERFLPDPFGATGDRMYATGDLAKWDEDGNLSFLGRADGQVKINGFRIEPAEIEAALEAHAGVARSAVIVRKSDDGGGHIVACVVAEPTAVLDEAPLHEHLAGQLPKYMLPAEIAILDTVPLTAHGKVDRPLLADIVLDLEAARRTVRQLPPQPGTPQYHALSAAVRVTGPVDISSLRTALGDVVARHQSLRIPPGHNGTRLDVVHTTEAHLPKALADVSRRNFEPESELPLRAHLLELSETEHVLVLVLRPGAGDRTSLKIVGADLRTAYSARLTGRSPDWDRPLVRYSDFPRWRTRNLGSGDDPGSAFSRQVAHWLSALDGLPAELPLPADHPRPATPTHRAGEARFEIGPGLHRALLTLADRTASTLPVVLQAAVATLLTRVGAGADIPLGTAVPSRPDSAFDEVVGWFTNHVVLRIDTSGDPLFTELLERVRTTRIAAAENADVPLRFLAERLGRRDPLFQVLLDVAETTDPVTDLDGARAEALSVTAGHTPFDLTFAFRGKQCDGEAPGGISGVVEFSRDLFTYDTARALAQGSVRLLRAVTAQPGCHLSEIVLEPDSHTEQPYASRAEIEQGLADLWTDLLDVPVDSADASFWELGGHSLLGVTLIARIRERFGVRLPLRDLFRQPHLGRLAEFIGAAKTEDAAIAVRGDKRPEPAVSSFQQRIWLAEKLLPEDGLYNVPMAWRVSGRLAPERLASALAKVVERHEALRTTFAERGGALRQVVGRPWKPEIGSHFCDSEDGLADRLRAEADQPFDLAAGPLMRVSLVETPDGQVLAITVHHIVFDVTSVQVLLDELDRHYRDERGEDPLPRQYRDLLAAHPAVDPAGLRRRVDQLRGAPGQLRMAVPARPESHGVIPLDLPGDLLRRMLPVQSAMGMSWFMVAAAALAATMHRWTGTCDVTFGFPADTRSGDEFAEVIGPCLNTVVVRSTCDATTTVAELLAAVRDEVLAAIDDRDVPFDAIVDALNPLRRNGSTPYLDVVLAPRTEPAEPPVVGGSSLIPLDLVRGTTGSVGKFTVSLSLVVAGDRMSGALLYRGDRLSAETASELAQLFASMFDVVLDDRNAVVVEAGHHHPDEGDRVPALEAEEPARVPGSTVEQRVAAIWSSLLELDRCDPHDNFFDVGGNSLKLVALHAELCREFSADLPIQRLFESSTVHTIALVLEGSSGDTTRPDSLDAGQRGTARRDRRQRRAGGR
ncbi:amino acid adenylation domain-containing protein [Amycolatopsis sp. NPDC088138]|uniref:amino acid adenylation domain-containing protein n=1 Tax=Amycolatopsis sp. NPDC088138 TaxID=3363938 RepID=UPI00381FD7ED